MKNLLILLIVFISSVVQITAQWSNISGQIPGGITAIAENQNNFIFAATDQNKVYRSDDNGITWTQLNVSPLFKISKFNFTSPGEIFASGDIGQVYYSSDNGLSWETRNSGIKNFDEILCVVKTSSGKLLAGAYTDCLSCSGGGIYSSTDNGLTWDFNAFLNNYVNSILFDNTTGFIYASAYPGVYRSSDDGVTWEQKNNGMEQYEFIKYLSITDDGVIYAGSEIYFGVMYKSTDNGDNWIQIPAGLPEDEISGLITIDDLVFVSYKNEGIYRTTNQGSGWSNISNVFDFYGNFEYNSISAKSGTLMSATSHGAFRTLDNGNNWDKFTHSITSLYISSLLTADNGNIIAGTDDGGIFYSNDEYEWFNNPLLSDVNDYQVFELEKNSEGMLFAAVKGYQIYNSLFRSVDNGVHWSHVGPSTYYGVYSLHLDSDDRIILGGYGKIFTSTNDGIDWTTIDIYIANSSHIYAISTINIDTIFIGTLHDGIFRSTDNGVNFLSSGLENEQVYSLLVDNSGYIYAGCSPGLYRSTDNGSTWELRNQGMGVTTVRDMALFKSDTIIAATSSGFYYSGDNGENWFEYSVGLENVVPLSVTNDINNIYCGTSGGLFKLQAVLPVELISFNAETDDNSVILNWITSTEKNNSGFEIQRRESGIENNNSEWIEIGFVEGKGTTTEQQSYSFIDENISSGKYHYRLKQIDFDGSYEYSNIVEVDVNQPLKFSLEQNYPNPFNPSTTIKIQIPVQSKVTLKVFDALGREIKTLVNEVKPNGIYEVEFDGNDLSSGIYFYQLSATGDERNYSSIKKMILLK